MVNPPLWKHQQDTLDKSKTVTNLALFHDLGTGKSRTTIEILRDKYNTNKKILRTLIICPSAILEKWKREILKYSAIPSGSVHVLDGTLIERAKEYSENEGIFITNIQSLAFPVFSAAVIKTPPNICVVDESHSFKDFTAKRTKALIKISYEMEKLPVHHRYILTGTPVLNSELDVFTQFLFLDCGATFGRNYYSYRGTYFRDANAFFKDKCGGFSKWVAQTGATEAIKAKMAPSVTLADKNLCLDLPELLRTEVDVVLSSEQKRAYEELKKDFITYVDTGVAVASLAVTKLLRMHQVLSGFLKLEGGEIHRFKTNPRADILSELLEDLVLKEKLIIWCVYHEDFQTVKNVLAKLNLSYAEVTGLVKDKTAELLKFETDPECRVMLASQSAGGTGCEMVAASTAIYYSKGYSLEHDFQSEARNYRAGSEKHHKILRIDLVARGTLDEIILDALRGKKNLATNILALKDFLTAK